MKLLPIVFIVPIGQPVSAQVPLAGLKEAIVAGANATGQTYQFASRCGAEAALLKEYKARFDLEAKAGRAKLYPDLGIDIDAEFKVGADVGNQFYDSIRAAPNRTDVCRQTTELIQSLVGGRR
jgi:hypothetical protein